MEVQMTKIGASFKVVSQPSYFSPFQTTQTINWTSLPEKIRYQYWRSKIEKDVKTPAGLSNIDESNPQAILDGIEYLLRMENNKHLGINSGVLRPETSQLFEPATANVNALYYISYLFHQKWNWGYVGAMALQDEKGKVNTPQAIKDAYTSYRKWFARIKEIGLDAARKAKLDPLASSKVSWY
jgi:hypothetical protein